jgi:hypothetical protein
VKTNGQLLYEHKHPAHVLAVLFVGRQFAKREDAFLTPNSVHQSPWSCLTESCKQTWEAQAVGHNLFSKKTS